tara:strand:- start:98 stop:304 length:207 start_codon:yes stop_codon:yes gene_type:complete
MSGEQYNEGSHMGAFNLDAMTADQVQDVAFGEAGFLVEGWIYALPATTGIVNHTNYICRSYWKDNNDV